MELEDEEELFRRLRNRGGTGFKATQPIHWRPVKTPEDFHWPE